MNLFGPTATELSLARVVFHHLLPQRPIGPNDEVRLWLEYTPDNGRAWLGEQYTRQPTQVDVAFELHRRSVSIGFLLIEVKLSEAFADVAGSSIRTRPGEHVRLA